MILDGKKIAAEIRKEVAEEVASLREKGIVPKLTVVQIGNNPASNIYVRNKERACKEVGIECDVRRLPHDVLEEIIYLEMMETEPHCVLVQLPLPEHLDEKDIMKRIPSTMDADGFTIVNAGKLMSGDYQIAPCTPAGIMELLKRYNIEVEGKRCVVVGRSDIVGKPMAMLLLHANGTVTICHSKTENLAEICREADILISAVGKPNFIRANMVKPGAVVIDVGINRTDDGKLVGDVAFDEVEPIASYITPVPGGVGPMTIAMLLKNTVKLCKIQEGVI